MSTMRAAIILPIMRLGVSWKSGGRIRLSRRCPQQFEQFRRRRGFSSLQRGELLALEGEPCSSVYWAAEGRLRVVKLSQDGVNRP